MFIFYYYVELRLNFISYLKLVLIRARDIFISLALYSLFSKLKFHVDLNFSLVCLLELKANVKLDLYLELDLKVDLKVEVELGDLALEAQLDL